MTTLEKEHDYRDEHFDFMQQWIRRFCLQHGAALFYTSAKEDKNCDLLYKYLTHKIYGLPFRTPALVVEKDAVLMLVFIEIVLKTLLGNTYCTLFLYPIYFIFRPAGWDTLKKISILYENMHTCKPDDYYRDVIIQPPTRKVSLTERFYIFIFIMLFIIFVRADRAEKLKYMLKMNKSSFKDNLLLSKLLVVA